MKLGGLKVEKMGSNIKSQVLLSIINDTKILANLKMIGHLRNQGKSLF